MPRRNDNFTNPRTFIAYAQVYFEKALAAIEENPSAECIVLQPHMLKNFFTSSHEALATYKNFFNTDGIPFLITPEDRLKTDEQNFEYGGKLLHILDSRIESTHKLLTENIENGKWILPLTDVPEDRRNYLVVKTTFESFPAIPISESFNILDNQCSPVHSVAIAAPKWIDEKHIDLLLKLRDL